MRDIITLVWRGHLSGRMLTQTTRLQDDCFIRLLVADYGWLLKICQINIAGNDDVGPIRNANVRLPTLISCKSTMDTSEDKANTKIASVFIIIDWARLPWGEIFRYFFDEKRNFANENSSLEIDSNNILISLVFNDDFVVTFVVRYSAKYWSFEIK